MLNFSLILLLLILAFKAIRALYFYQLKEYRLDRLYDFFRYDNGLKSFFSILGTTAYLLIIISLLTKNTQFFNIALLLAILDLLNLNLRKLKLRFTPTAKSMLIFFLFLVASTILAFQNSSAAYLLAQPILIIIIIAFTPITILAKEYKISKAKSKISNFKNLKIIVITGSYGKSSTKEFLAQILQEKFHILKTPKNINSDIGVANIILSQLNSSHQIFIVEAGAYKVGEIANIVKMFESDYAILTSISNQHLSLFGTIQNTIKAKSEIANTLKPNGKFFLNIDDQILMDLIPSFQNRNLITYGKTQSANLICSNITQAENLSFQLNNQSYQSTAFGLHNAINLIPCIAIAQDLGMTETEISKALSMLSNPTNTLSQKTGYKNCTIIDDSYNSNLTGFLNAIDYCNSLPAKKKILITMGLVELGPDTKSSHIQIAKKAIPVFDQILLTKKELLPYFTPSESVKYLNTNSLITELSAIIDSDTLVLIENRLNPKVYNFLLSN